MENLSYINEVLFFEFLSGQKTISEFEEFVYANKFIEKEIGTENYIILISFNYKSDSSELISFIKNKIIKEYRFESWKMRRVLELLVFDSKNINKHLDEIYDLYFGICNDLGERKYEFKFLKHLVLNYFYWLDEGYLKMNFEESWEVEYKERIKYFDFYHEQLKPFAESILLALNNKEIEVLEDGTYKITEELKKKLELNDLYKLQHPKDF